MLNKQEDYKKVIEYIFNSTKDDCSKKSKTEWEIIIWLRHNLKSMYEKQLFLFTREEKINSPIGTKRYFYMLLNRWGIKTYHEKNKRRKKVLQTFIFEINKYFMEKQNEQKESNTKKESE